MRSLQAEISWCTRKQWIILLCILAITGAFLLFVCRPAYGRRTELREQKVSIQRQIDADQTQLARLPAVRAEVESLRQKLARFDRKLPRSQELDQFLNDISQVRQQYALGKWKIVREAPKKSATLSELPINIDFEGDFVGAFGFLRQTEEMQRLTRIRELRIIGKDNHQGQVEVHVKMNIYFSEG
jgi:Tfp pilus assembly protein PilO